MVLEWWRGRDSAVRAYAAATQHRCRGGRPAYWIAARKSPRSAGGIYAIIIGAVEVVER
jgi:hypothetical protein